MRRRLLRHHSGVDFASDRAVTVDEYIGKGIRFYVCPPSLDFDH
ncbi:MAG TPA: hypothetical protein VF377_02000 [Acidimicrobiia bacterium]